MFSDSSSLRRSSSTFSISFAIALLAAAAAGAQQMPQPSTLPDSPVAQQSSSQHLSATDETVTLPAGTRLVLVLTHVLESKPRSAETNSMRRSLRQLRWTTESRFQPEHLCKAKSKT
jgi:hypothetical protein